MSIQPAMWVAQNSLIGIQELVPVSKRHYYIFLAEECFETFLVAVPIWELNANAQLHPQDQEV